MTYIIFIAFYNLFFFIGRGFYCLLLTKNYLRPNKKIFNLDINLFFPLIGLFAIGNITFLINFFIKISQSVTLICILCLLLLNLLYKKLNLDKNVLIYNFLLPLLMSFSSNGANLHYDASLYHLQFQNWLKSYKIIGNLVLTHSRNGYSSIYDYISSNFWWGENFLLLHFVNLVFITSFISIMIYFIFFQKNIFLKYSSLAIIIYAFLDNFGYSGGRNGFIYIESIGKQDVAFAIVFYLVFLFIIYSIKYNQYSYEELFWIISFSLFAVQLRIYGIFLIPVLIFYLIKLNQNLNFLSMWKYTIIQIIIGILWIIKNLISTGCLFFPVSITCFDKLNIYGAELAKRERNELFVFHKGYSFNENFFEWLNSFLNHTVNKQIVFNFLLSFFIIRVFFKLIFIEKRSGKVPLFFTISISLFINFIVLITSAPGDRFFIHLFLILIGITYFVTVDELLYRNNYFKSIVPVIIIFISIFSVVLIPRLSDYVNVRSGFLIKEINSEKIEYQKIDDSWGTRPINSEHCWEKIDCVYENIDLYFNQSQKRFDVRN